MYKKSQDVKGNILIVLYSCALWSTSQPVLASELPQLKTKMQCIVAAESELTQTNKIFTTWLTNKDSPYYILTRFEQLRQRYEIYFDKLHRLSTENKPLVQSEDDLRRILNDIDNKYRETTMTKQVEITNQEYYFIADLETIERGLAKNKASLQGYLSPCGEEYTGLATPLLAEIDNWLDRLYNMRKFCTEAAKKRTLLTEYLQKKMNYQVRQDYAKQKLIDMATLENNLTKVLNASYLYDEIEAWHFKAVLQNGVGAGLYRDYHQFEEPLRIMKVDLFQGRQFYSRLSELGRIAGNVDEKIKRNLDKYVSTLKDSINYLESLGHQGVMAEQIETAIALKSMIGVSEVDCTKALDDYLKLADKTKSLIEYRTAEESYFRARISCGE